MTKVYFMRVGSDSNKENKDNEPVPFSMIVNKKLLFIPICSRTQEKIQQYSYNKLCEFETHKDMKKYFGKINTKKDCLDFHLDPFLNFNGEGEFSYGDRKLNKNGENITKAIALEKFKDEKDSYLFFLATVVEPNENSLKEFEKEEWKKVRKKQKPRYMQKKLALIGYIKVIEVKIIDKNNINKEKPYIMEKFKNNSHVKRNDFNRCIENPDQKLFFILGDPNKSEFLFKNYVILGESKNRHYELTKNGKKFFKNRKNSIGYRESSFWWDKDDLDMSKLLV